MSGEAEKGSYVTDDSLKIMVGEENDEPILPLTADDGTTPPKDKDLKLDWLKSAQGCLEEISIEADAYRLWLKAQHGKLAENFESVLYRRLDKAVDYLDSLVGMAERADLFWPEWCYGNERRAEAEAAYRETNLMLKTFGEKRLRNLSCDASTFKSEADRSLRLATKKAVKREREIEEGKTELEAFLRKKTKCGHLLECLEYVERMEAQYTPPAQYTRASGRGEPL